MTKEKIRPFFGLAAALFLGIAGAVWLLSLSGSEAVNLRILLNCIPLLAAAVAVGIAATKNKRCNMAVVVSVLAVALAELVLLFWDVFSQEKIRWVWKSGSLLQLVALIMLAVCAVSAVKEKQILSKLWMPVILVCLLMLLTSVVLTLLMVSELSSGLDLVQTEDFASENSMGNAFGFLLGVFWNAIQMFAAVFAGLAMLCLVAENALLAPGFGLLAVWLGGFALPKTAVKAAEPQRESTTEPELRAEIPKSAKTVSVLENETMKPDVESSDSEV